jgi:uncharacterized protein (TIGR02266 family)
MCASRWQYAPFVYYRRPEVCAMANDPQSPSTRQGERALAELEGALTAIAEDAIRRPHTDPQGAAATALLVADAQKDEELTRYARAILWLVGRLDGEYLPDAKGVPGDLVQRGFAVRTTVLTALEQALHDQPEVMQWVEAIRLGSGVVDLVYDLRTVADVSDQHLPGSDDPTSSAVRSARSAADALEFALRSGESTDDAKVRTTIARLWTLFVPAYEKVTRDTGGRFPALALVAARRRARKRPVSVVPPPRITLPPATSVAAAPERGSVATATAETPEPREVLRSEPPPPPPPRSSPDLLGDRPSWTEGRRARRSLVEIEVSVASESNLYVGFTENVSATGVFIATYASRPMGAKVEVSLSFPDGETLQIPGIVKWLRDASTEGWPGIGVEFEALSPEDEKKLHAFVALRDPLFYPD